MVSQVAMPGTRSRRAGLLSGLLYAGGQVPRLGNFGDKGRSHPFEQVASWVTAQGHGGQDASPLPGRHPKPSIVPEARCRDGQRPRVAVHCGNHTEAFSRLGKVRMGVGGVQPLRPQQERV